jgi:hypothetical protein
MNVNDLPGREIDRTRLRTHDEIAIKAQHCTAECKRFAACSGEQTQALPWAPYQRRRRKF